MCTVRRDALCGVCVFVQCGGLGGYTVMVIVQSEWCCCLSFMSVGGLLSHNVPDVPTRRFSIACP